MNFLKFLRINRVAVIIFFFAVVVRLALFFVYLDFNHGNFISTIWGVDGYSDISENLIHGNGYSDAAAPPYAPNSLRPPVWIFIIAAMTKVFGSYVPIFVFQLILSSLIPILGMYIAGKIISPSRITIVGILLALEPAAVFSATMLASETSFAFFFLAFVIFLFRYFDNQTTRNIVWSAVFLGLAVLIKPTVQFLPIFVPTGLVFIYRKHLSFNLMKHFVFFIAVSLLVVAPWIYRNQKEFHAWGITSQPAYNLYTVLVPTVLSIEKGTNYEAEHQVVQRKLDMKGDEITLSNASYYTRQALSVLSKHKEAFMKSIGISVITFFTHDHMLTVLGYGGVTVPNLLEKPAIVLLLTNPHELARDILAYAASPAILVLLVRLFWIAVTLLFFSGAAVYLRREKFSPFACLALGMVAYFALMTAANGFGMNGRFRIPVNAFIFTFALYGFSVLRSMVFVKFFSKNEKTFNHNTGL